MFLNYAQHIFPGEGEIFSREGFALSAPPLVTTCIYSWSPI